MQGPLTTTALAVVLGMIFAHVTGLPAWMHGVVACAALATVPLPGTLRDARLFLAAGCVGAWMLASDMDRKGPLDAAMVIPAEIGRAHV